MFKRVPSIRVPSIGVPSIGVPMIGVRGRGEKREPSPYIELPYIVSNGNSWADTGLYLDPTIHRVQGSFIVDSLDIISTANLYPTEGARDSSVGVKTNTMIRKLSPTTYEIRRDWGRSSNGNYDSTVYEVGKEYTFDYTPEYTEINGVRIDIVPEKGGVSKYSYGIGYMNDGGSLVGFGYVPPAVRGTKRTFSVYATGEVIGLSTPTLDKKTDIFDYFDKVSGKYLENKGTEPFTGAYEAWVYQMGRPLSYLQSDGNQWIDTGYVFKSTNQRKIIRVQNPVDSSTLQVANGSQGTSGRSPYVGYLNGLVRIGYGGQTASTSPITFPMHQEATTYDLETFTDNTFRFADDKGVEHTGDWTATVVTERSEYLFKLNIESGTYTSASEILFYQAYDDGIKVIDLIPFITWEGIKGFLNLVNRELLLNQGTGEFQVPIIPVYAINWEDETFDPIAGKVAEIGTGLSSPLLWNDWTDAQKATFRGKKMVGSWKADFTNAEFETLRVVIGCNTRIYYTDGTYTSVNLNQYVETLVNGLTSPYTMQGASYTRSIQIEDKEIDNIVYYQPQFFLPRVQSGELKAYDIKWEVDVPEYEIEAIETLNASGIRAYANHEDNIKALNRIGIKI